MPRSLQSRRRDLSGVCRFMAVTGTDGKQVEEWHRLADALDPRRRWPNAYSHTAQRRIKRLARDLGVKIP